MAKSTIIFLAVVVLQVGLELEAPPQALKSGPARPRRVGGDVLRSMQKIESPVLERLFPGEHVYRVSIRNRKIAIAGQPFFFAALIVGGQWPTYVEHDGKAVGVITARAQPVVEVSEALDRVVAFAHLRAYRIRYIGPPADRDDQPINWQLRIEQPDGENWLIRCVMRCDRVCYAYEFTVSPDGKLTAKRGEAVLSLGGYRSPCLGVRQDRTVSCSISAVRFGMALLRLRL